MKKWTFLGTFLVIFSFNIFADVEQDIGFLTLTKNQQGRMTAVHSSTVKGIQYSEGNIKAVVTRNLNSSERTNLLADLGALSNAPLDDESDRSDFATSPFKGVTPDDADTWIQNNVTDLASAKVALRKMARVLIYLLRRSDLE